MTQTPQTPSWFVKRDFDGFFALLIDNLVQILSITFFCTQFLGMTGESGYLLTQRIFPGVAVSLIAGNLFYSWQAYCLGVKQKRNDVTALPYGINTPSLIVYVFFVMLPAYIQSGSAEFAWKMGLIACLGSGIIELIGALVADLIRKYTPRAALLSTLSGIAIGFIAMSFALQIFQKPLLAMPTLAIVLATLFGKAKFPFRLPGGLLAIFVGTAIAWVLTGLFSGQDGLPIWISQSLMSPANVSAQFNQSGFTWPFWFGGDLLDLLFDWKQWFMYLTVIIPMGLFNLLGSLQNIESAEAAGDSYSARNSLAINGVGTIIAACFGSCFPTTIYIGHPGWKDMGARIGYSVLNGVVITVLCFSGLIGLVSAIIPIEVGAPIVLWIGIVITAQAFSANQIKHAPAVAIGMFPAIAAWGATVLLGTLSLAEGKTLQDLLSAELQEGGMATSANGFLMLSLNSIERGYIFTCVVLGAMATHLIDRQWLQAAFWSVIGALLAFTGLTHALTISANSIDFLFLWQTAVEGQLSFRANGIAIGYLLMAAVFVGLHLSAQNESSDSLNAEKPGNE